jgi:molybdopterin synthase catalytic subunit
MWVQTQLFVLLILRAEFNYLMKNILQIKRYGILNILICRNTDDLKAPKHMVYILAAARHGTVGFECLMNIIVENNFK